MEMIMLIHEVMNILKQNGHGLKDSEIGSTMRDKIIFVEMK